MIGRGNSMGPQGGNRPPWCWPQTARQHPIAALPIDFPLVGMRTDESGQEDSQNVVSMADYKGPDRCAPGHDPTDRMIGPWRTDKMISASRTADDRIAGCL
jgi:hypothetical protein